ncbi:hypothetical protein ALC60_05654 [Trachymyrmex zeteki]|uniref:Uncharacterized protein n=1 Tax=Mycetomoellerius zeteki TaxID=64791 RepID=A0A151X551_9HYME|nr:hypothetical protein ALC60_03899 [Trachymyrmex zeteki]KYQ55454.1 hypothetical protein ALC60_05654 [Trachymyrmex zeteki]
MLINVNVDNYPLCDLSNYNMSIEEEEMLLLLENLNIVDIIIPEEVVLCLVRT